jgi:pimeloyl-ACP methyl ester carboxylesterase
MLEWDGRLLGMSKIEFLPITYGEKTCNVAVKRRMSRAADHLLLGLHGLGCNQKSLHGLFSARELQDYSVCTMDFLGFGESDKPTDFSYDLAAQADIARQVVDHTEAERVTIIGHSMGGAIGTLLAVRLSNLDGFVNMEGNLVGEDCGLVSRGVAEQSLEEFERHGYAAFIELLTSSDRQDFHEWATWYADAAPHAVHASARSMVEWSDSDELLPMLNRLDKKAYMYGDEESKEYILNRFQNVDVRYIPKLGHFMATENPAAFYSELAEVLDRFRSSPY